MSTSILPDGSVVVRLPLQTVHIDVRTRAIHLRAPSRDELSGSILESFPYDAVDRIRLIREDRAHLLFIELRSGRVLSLGQAPSHDMAMVTARVVADLTRCRVEVADRAAGPIVSGEASLPDTVDESIEGSGLPPYEPKRVKTPAPAAAMSLQAKPAIADDGATTDPPDDPPAPVQRKHDSGSVPPAKRDSAPATPAKHDSGSVPPAKRDSAPATPARPPAAADEPMRIVVPVPAPRAPSISSSASASSVEPPRDNDDEPLIESVHLPPISAETSFRPETSDLVVPLASAYAAAESEPDEAFTIRIPTRARSR